MGELSVIFGELVRMLKELPPEGFDKAYSTRPVANVANNPVSFMCDKQSFKDVVRLAELGARLAKQAHNPGERASDPSTESIMAGIKSLEAKVDQLALETAALAVRQTAPDKSYAEALSKKGHLNEPRAKTVPEGKGKKPPSPPARQSPPKLLLAQLTDDKQSFVELISDAGALAARASSALKNALQRQAAEDGKPPPPPHFRSRYYKEYLHWRDPTSPD